MDEKEYGMLVLIAFVILLLVWAAARTPTPDYTLPPEAVTEEAPAAPAKKKMDTNTIIRDKLGAPPF